MNTSRRKVKCIVSVYLDSSTSTIILLRQSQHDTSLDHITWTYYLPNSNTLNLDTSNLLQIAILHHILHSLLLSLITVDLHIRSGCRRRSSRRSFPLGLRKTLSDSKHAIDDDSVNAFLDLQLFEASARIHRRKQRKDKEEEKKAYLHNTRIIVNSTIRNAHQTRLLHDLDESRTNNKRFSRRHNSK